MGTIRLIPGSPGHYTVNGQVLTLYEHALRIRSAMTGEPLIPVSADDPDTAKETIIERIIVPPPPDYERPPAPASHSCTGDIVVWTNASPVPCFRAPMRMLCDRYWQAVMLLRRDINDDDLIDPPPFPVQLLKPGHSICAARVPSTVDADDVDQLIRHALVPVQIQYVCAEKRTVRT